MRFIVYAFRIAVAGVLVWALAVAALWAFQDRLIFRNDDRPLGDPPASLPAFVADRLATADGLTLRSWLAAPQPGKPVIVYFHGNAGNAGDRAETLRPLLEAGYGIALTEYRGYGGNPGDPSEIALLADGARHVARMRLRFPGHAIVLWGESLGAGIAIPLAARDGVAGLIVDSAFTSLLAIAREKYPFGPPGMLLRSRFDNLATIGSVHVPLLVLHGEADTIVPASHGRALFEAANEPKRGLFLPGVGHLAIAADESGQAMAAARDFLAQFETAR